MKLLMKVKHSGEPDAASWDEEIDTDTTQCIRMMPKGLTPLAYANGVIDFFNDTRRPGEHERALVTVTAL